MSDASREAFDLNNKHCRQHIYARFKKYGFIKAWAKLPWKYIWQDTRDRVCSKKATP